MKDFLQNYTILYVEDEPGIRESLSEYLQEFFRDVYVAADGIEGLEQYRTRCPDVLLLDIDLPGMDGLSLARAVREHDRKTIIIMLTAFADRKKLLDATELGLLKYLVKPIDPRQFGKTLDKLAHELEERQKPRVWIGTSHSWSPEDRQLHERGIRVDLTEKECRALMLLVSHRHQDVTFEELMVHVWDDAFDRDISFNSVKNIISSLRKKLPPNTIQNVYGKGYVLN